MGLIFIFCFFGGAVDAFAKADVAWFPFSLNWSGVAAIADNGVLTEPAGNRGFISVGEGGHYYAGGQRIRFFGVQVPPSKDAKEAETLARRLADYGFNLWRTHLLYVAASAKEAVNRFDASFSAMKAEGLYTYLQLHGGGRLLRAAAGNEKFRIHFGLKKRHVKNLKRGRWHPNQPDILIVYLMEPAIVQAERKSWRELLSHVNPYTKLAYKDDPAVLCMELTNECYLLGAWEMGMLLEGVFPAYYEAYFQELWNEWLLNEAQSSKLKAESSKLKAERGERSEGGGQKAEDGGRKAEDRRRKAEDGGRKTEDGRRPS